MGQDQLALCSHWPGIDTAIRDFTATGSHPRLSSIIVLFFGSGFCARQTRRVISSSHALRQGAPACTATWRTADVRPAALPWFGADSGPEVRADPIVSAQTDVIVLIAFCHQLPPCVVLR
jgi:hypothetical protein